MRFVNPCRMPPTVFVAMRLGTPLGSIAALGLDESSTPEEIKAVARQRRGEPVTVTMHTLAGQEAYEGSLEVS
jgi:hypothetical protein